MRPRYRAVIGAVIAFAAIVAGVPAAADEFTKNFVSKVLESFNAPGTITWTVTSSDRVPPKDWTPQFTYVDAWPDQVYGANKKNEVLRSMAIRCGFNRKAYNWIEIVPTDTSKKDENGQPFSGIEIPGRVQLIDLWVWGSNYNYWLDIHLQDYRGVDHVLHMGSLQYAGWRNLSVTVPGSIPQSSPYLPRLRTLTITKLVLWTRPDAPVNGFYVFFDDLKVLTDLAESRFDGDELADPDYLNALWSAGKK